MATKYVETWGNDTTGTGSAAAPYLTIRKGLTEAGAQGTVIVGDGTYGYCELLATDAGVLGTPTTIIAANKWGAKVLADTTHRGFAIPEDCDWIVIDGFEVTGGGPNMIGIYANLAENLVIKNNWVHHNLQTGILIANATSGTIERNLVEYNGVDGALADFPHGIYVYTSGITVRNNMVRYNAGYGIHAYNMITGCTVYGNIVYGCEHGGILCYATAAGGGSGNVIVNNTIGTSRTSDYACLEIPYMGATDIVANNVVLGGTNPNFSFASQVSAPTINYNYCSPADVLNTPNAITADPKLYDVTQNMYWPLAGSSLIAAGSNTYAPAVDFWGSALPATVHVGAIPYTPYLNPGRMMSDPWDLSLSSSPTIQDQGLLRHRPKRRVSEFKPKLWLDGSSMIGSGVAADSVGTFPATLTSMDTVTSWSTDTPHYRGYSLEFAGTDDLANTGSTEVVPVGAATFAAWMKVVGYGGGGFGRIFSDGLTYLHVITPFVVRLTSDNSTFAATANGAFAFDTWTHVCVKRSAAGAANLFINGVLSGTANQATGTPAGGTSAFCLGNRADAARGFDGKLDDVRIYNVALSNADILLLSQGGEPATAPVNHWTFDEGPYNNPANAVALAHWNSRDATHSTFVQATAANRPVYTAATKSVTFAGTNDYLKIASAVLSGTTTGRVMIVCNTTVTNALQVLYSQAAESSADNYLHLGISAGNKLWYKFDHGGDLTAVELTGGIALGTGWNVCEWASDGSAITMWLNGEPQDITTVGGTNAGQWFGDVDTPVNTVLGARETTAVGDYLTGSIAEIAALELDDTYENAQRLRTTLCRKHGITQLGIYSEGFLSTNVPLADVTRTAYCHDVLSYNTTVKAAGGVDYDIFDETYAYTGSDLDTDVIATYIASEGAGTTPILWNIELLNPYTQTAQFISDMTTILSAWQAGSTRPMGLYNMVPWFDYWGPVLFADNADKTFLHDQGIGVKSRYQRKNEVLWAALGQYVDFVVPYAYRTHFAAAGFDDFKNAAVCEVAEAVRLAGGKPVYPIIGYHITDPPAYGTTSGTAGVLTDGVLVPVEAVGWTNHGLIGWQVRLGATNWYTITHNETDRLTVASPPANGNYNWALSGLYMTEAEWIAYLQYVAALPGVDAIMMWEGVPPTTYTFTDALLALMAGTGDFEDT